MLKSVAIIELDYHSEALKYLIEILADIRTLNFHIFSSEEIIKRTGFSTNSSIPNVSFHIKSKAESADSFIASNIKLINNNDLVYFNTLVSNCEVYLKYPITTKKCLRIHNSNTYLHPNLAYKFILDPLLIYKDISYFIRKAIFKLELINRSKLIETMDNFVFYSDCTLSYAKENYPKYKNQIFNQSLPIEYYDSNRIAHFNKEKTIITVIGTVDRRRRNYQLVIDVLEILKTVAHAPLEFHFLGKPVGRNGHTIISKLKKYDSENTRIITYNKFVENEEFETTIQQSDFILVPLNMQTRFTLFEEKYGDTKISGNVYDAIRFGKPAIINAEYKLDEQIASSFLLFNDKQSLSKILIDINKYKNIYPDYSYFSKENVVSMYETAFSQMCQ